MMHTAYEELRFIGLTGNWREDVVSFLQSHGMGETAEHCVRVGQEARALAIQVGADPEKAEIAGYLHDVSAVFPNERRNAAARSLGIEVLPEEETFPMIIHQKLSRAMAEDLFQIHDTSILSAIECHTTLKKQSSLLDQVVFVADKISWDQQGIPPYLQKLKMELERSITHAAYAYIDDLWQKKEQLRVIHPWLREAHEELSERLNTQIDSQ